jgi:hypothetical protein
MGNPRRATIALIPVAALGVATWWIGFRPPTGVVTRSPSQNASAADAYFSELSAVPASELTDVWSSPDARYVASNVMVAETYHTVGVRARSGGSTVQVVSIREADPHSGRSHYVRWSAGSRALLVGGGGSLYGRHSKRLCLVYVIDDDALLEAKPCS